MPTGPLFIVGTERSGSNLLRLILNAHPGICIPHPPHVMNYFASLEGGYGPLDRDEAFRRLTRDVLRLVRVHIYPWDFEPTEEELMRNAPSRDVFGLFVALYELHAKSDGKPRWGCKSTFMIHHADRILRQFPDAKLLWLIRDPRDVATSSLTSVFNPFHPYLTGSLWAEQQRLGLAFERRTGQDSIHRIAYADLVQDPENCIRGICAFLDEPFHPAMMQFHDSAEARKSGKLSESWRNTAKSFLPARVGRYRSVLTATQIQDVERAAGEVMPEFGFRLETRLPDEVLSSARLFRIRSWDRWQRWRIELRAALRDRNYTRRLARGLLLSYLRLRRGGRPDPIPHPTV